MFGVLVILLLFFNLLNTKKGKTATGVVLCI